MNATQPPSITIRQIEFELEKAEHGMALPYDAERVWAIAQDAGRGAQAEALGRAGGAAKASPSCGDGRPSAGKRRRKWGTMMNEEDCLGARFEILLDGKTRYCRDTMVTAMGAANIIEGQNPKSRVAVRDLQTGQLTVLPATPQQ